MSQLYRYSHPLRSCRSASGSTVSSSASPPGSGLLRRILTPQPGAGVVTACVLRQYADLAGIVVAGLGKLLDPLPGDVIDDLTRAVLARPLLAAICLVQLQGVQFFAEFGIRLARSSSSAYLPPPLPDRPRSVSALPLGSRSGSCTFRPLLALFVLAEVMAHRGRNLLQRLFADARDLFQLLRRHVGQRLDRRDAGSHQLLDDRLAQLGHLFDRRRRTAAQRLHLLLDLLALLFLALDVDLPAQQLRGQTHILPLLADGQRELCVVDDDLQLLFGQIGDADAAHLGRLQRLLGEGRHLFARTR